MMRIAVLAVAAALLAGCTSSAGNPPVISGVGTVASPYAGPMRLPLDESVNATVLQRSGAAGRALECDFEPYFGGTVEYDDGLRSVQSTAEAALREQFANAIGRATPSSGYRVERRDGDRVLFSYDVDGRTKVAFIAADGVYDYKGHAGWGIESWAECDPAELPEAVSAELAIQVWQDSSGRRAPVAKVQSFLGAKHCDWQDITFLMVDAGAAWGAGRGQTYVRDPRGVLADSLAGGFAAHTNLPAGAVDSGFNRDGRELWVVAGKAAYLVSAADPADVERWPATTRAIGCA